MNEDVRRFKRSFERELDWALKLSTAVIISLYPYMPFRNPEQTDEILFPTLFPVTTNFYLLLSW